VESATAELKEADFSTLEDFILDARLLSGRDFRVRRAALLAEVRARAKNPRSEAEACFLVGHAIWTLGGRLGTSASLEALQALTRSERDPNLEQMSRLLKLYIFEATREYRATLLEFDRLDFDWFDSRSLQWRWLTSLECRFSALVRMGFGEAVPVFEEVLGWLEIQDEIGAAPPKVLVDAVTWGMKHGRFPSELHGTNPLMAIGQTLEGSGMEWLTEDILR
jgi:hypothetical protein